MKNIMWPSMAGCLLLNGAVAQDTDVIFNGSISSTCTIVADSAGTLAANGTNTVLASTEAGATTASGVTGTTQTSLGLGVTSLSVNASATKSSGIYEAGTYQLTTTIRCST